MPELVFPLLCPRCKLVTMRSKVENFGTTENPYCVACYWETQNEPDIARALRDGNEPLLVVEA